MRGAFVKRIVAETRMLLDQIYVESETSAAKYPASIDIAHLVGASDAFLSNSRRRRVEKYIHRSSSACTILVAFGLTVSTSQD